MSPSRPEGVGASIREGCMHARARGASIVVVLAGDGQMDPADLPALIAPITRGEADMRCLASQRRDKRLQMFLEHYAPNAGTGEDLIVHDGETAALVVEGTIELEIGGKAHTIGAGGGYQLFSGVPYRIRNAGDTPVVVVCAVTPPML